MENEEIKVKAGIETVREFKDRMSQEQWPDGKDESTNLAEKNVPVNKRKAKMFWFVKIPRDFYLRPECQQLIINAASNAEGITRCAIYERMLLQSCGTDGRLFLTSRCPYTPLTLTTTLGLDSSKPEEVKIVTDTIKILKECGVVYLDEKATIILTTFPELTESTTEQAIKKRQERLAKSITVEEQARIEETIKIAKMKWLEG